MRILLFLLALPLGAAGIAFEAYTAMGSRLPVRVLSFIDERESDHASEFNGGEHQMLTDGVYRYRVSAGRTAKSGYITLFRSRRLVVLFGESRVFDPKSGEEYHVDSSARPSEVLGRVVGFDNTSGLKLWVRVQSVFDPVYVVDSEIGSDGRFTVSLAPSGKCTLLVFGDGRPLHLRLIDIPSNGELKVTLESSNLRLPPVP